MNDVKKVMEQMIESHYKSVLSQIDVLLTIMEENPKYRNEALLDNIGDYLKKFRVSPRGRGENKDG